MEKLLPVLIILLMVSTVSAVNFTTEVLDSDSNTVSSELTLENSSGLVKTTSNSLQAEIAAGSNYNLTQNISENIEVKIVNFSTTSDIDFRPRYLNLDIPEQNQFLTGLNPFYYVNQSISFDYASIDTGESSNPDRVAECLQLNNFECQGWDVKSIDQYQDNSGSATETYTYRVNSFSGYSTGDNSSLSKIKEISLYNDSGLIETGENTTFNIKQSNSETYRFEFNITNNGSEAWNLDSEDLISHSGLNSSWNVRNISYKLDGVKEGGDFTNGKILWDTSNGGSLAKGGSMKASYNFTADQPDSESYDLNFTVENNFSEGETDLHDLKLKKLGDIQAELNSPENDTVLQRYDDFYLNGTVECLNGVCGEITADPLSNGSGLNQGFDLLETVEQCGTLSRDELCEVSWRLNATGDDESNYNLSFEASSNYSEVKNNESNVSEVEIQEILIVDTDFDTVDFGTLAPGEDNRSASRNIQGYNLTVNESSNWVDNLWLKGSDLVHSTDSNYTIGISNMSYIEVSNGSQIRLNDSYSLVDTSLAPGTVKTYNYFLDTPEGILRGDYSGSITFKVNQTS
jgi:hypothetical protein